MTAAVGRRVDDEGLPLPPPVHGKAARWVLRMPAYGEGVMFLAIAVALLAIAVVVFVRGLQIWCSRPGVVLALSVALVLVRRFPPAGPRVTGQESYRRHDLQSDAQQNHVRPGYRHLRGQVRRAGDLRLRRARGGCPVRARRRGA